MKFRYRIVALLALGTVALSAAPGEARSKAKPTVPRTAEQLAAMVVRTGMGCTDYEASDQSSEITISGVPKGDEGDCTIDGQHSNLAVYRTRADFQAVLAAIPTIGCAIAKPFGVTTSRYVVGPTWFISTPSSATQPKLAKALNANAKTIKCT
jgi:hypothetical protein